MKFVASLAACLLLAGGVGPTLAEDAKPIEVSLKGEVFTPSEIEIPVGQTVVVRFRNLNAGPAEIESKALKIEKVVPGGGEILANVKARAAGRFLFVDEYHEDVAKGFFVAK
jgi:plastocyanin